ncbi:MAG: hypothetical protein P1V51_18040 [Deltaproteobacteria bacterium]|nr:hypothetical protein [Deltaproteobacteria bacterium]
MSKKSQQTALNNHFAIEQADLQTRVLLLEDLVATLEQTLSGLLAHLQASGDLAPDASFARKWDEALAILREAGWKERPLPGEAPKAGVTCPGCSSVLRNVTGAPGERCDWCGHVFVLVCPGCQRELENLFGEPGDVCLHCQHRF